MSRGVVLLSLAVRSLVASTPAAAAPLRAVDREARARARAVIMEGGGRRPSYTRRVLLERHPSLTEHEVVRRASAG